MKYKYGSGDIIIKKDKQSCILPSIIKIFLMASELCSRNENKGRIWIKGTYLVNEDKQSCHSCKPHSVWTCSILLPCIIKIFPMVTELYSRNENEIKKNGSGDIIRNEDKQSCHSCTRHSVLTCSIILPSIIKIFLMVTELCSGNENEVILWIRGHN